jgi:CelD/BcsL family acetyltransferase involved in cellulose biosynthesis
MRESAARGDVRAYLLFKDGEAVAYIYFEAENGILSYSYVGHEAELSQLSPGTVLMTVAMEDLCQEGHFNWLDFGYGTGQHKSVFSSETVRVAHVYLLKRNTRNFLLVHSHSALNRATETLTKLLVRLDIHQRIKRFVRRTASVHKSE